MVVARAPSLLPRQANAIENLFPGYFALVMATGVMSIAAKLSDMAWVAHALLWSNVLFFLALAALNLLRLVLYPTRVVAAKTRASRTTQGSSSRTPARSRRRVCRQTAPTRPGPTRSKTRSAAPA